METTGFGVIGVGTWGELHARVYSHLTGARLVAVCDADPHRAHQVAAACGGTKVYTDFFDIVDDPEIAAVSIVLPDFLHHEAAIAAARAGKHILLEKPLATTEAEALHILQEAEKAGVHLFVDFHNRWSPLFQPLKTSLERGEIGQPQQVYYRLSDTLYVPTKMLSWSGHSTVAWFLASHSLDTLLWLMNARQHQDRVERLYCVARSRVLREQYDIDTPDFYLTTLEWASGLVTHVENSWILPESGPSIFDLKCEFIGSNGAYSIDASHHGAVKRQTAKVEFPDLFVTPSINGYPMGFGAESIRHFAQCIIHREQPLVDGRDGLAVTRLILKMEESVRLRQPVEVGDLYAV
jgi:predicted dehydrogenase